MIEEILALLEKLEWSGKSREDFGHNDYSTVPCCPICGRQKWYEPYGHLNEGHTDECELARILEGR